MRDDAETAKLAALRGELQGIEDALPIDAAMKNPKLGALAPIRVVNERLRRRRRGNRGVQTAAYNLPNDERIVQEKGSKRVMLKNVQEAKFAKVLAADRRGRARARPIAPRWRSTPFFTHILMHELLHGLGPHEIAVGGRETTVRAELSDTVQRARGGQGRRGGPVRAPEAPRPGEARPRACERTLYPTFLASAFRSIRFGVGEAHGKGMALQLNWLLDARRDHGRRPDGRSRSTRADAGGGRRAHPRDHDHRRGGATVPRRRRCSSGWRSSGRRCSACSTGSPTCRSTSRRGS